MTVTGHKTPVGMRGFTLTELLVVILILAVLAMLLFALTRRAMDKAATSTCSSNLRQIGIALASHDSDKRRFPGQNEGLTWDRAIIPYFGYSGDKDLRGTQHFNRNDWQDLMRVAEIFACPADKKPRDANVFKRSYSILPWTTNWSNGTQFRGWKNRPFNQGVPLSIVPDPSRAATVVEWHSGDNDGVPNRLGAGGHAYHDRGGPDGPKDRLHGRNQIVLFADGHTEVLPFMSNAEFVKKYWPGEIGNVN